MISLKLDEDEKKEIEKKEKEEKKDPVKISHKYLKKVIILYLYYIILFREEK